MTFLLGFFASTWPATSAGLETARNPRPPAKQKMSVVSMAAWTKNRASVRHWKIRTETKHGHNPTGKPSFKAISGLYHLFLAHLFLGSHPSKEQFVSENRSIPIPKDYHHFIINFPIEEAQNTSGYQDLPGRPWYPSRCHHQTPMPSSKLPQAPQIRHAQRHGPQRCQQQQPRHRRQGQQLLQDQESLGNSSFEAGKSD